MTEAKPTDAKADNAVVDEAMFTTDETLASLRFPPYLMRDFESAGYSGHDGGIGCGVVRVNVSIGGIGLSVALEDGDTDFSLSVMPMLDREQALELADAIRETVEGMEELEG